MTQDKVACRRFIDEIKSWSDLFMEICMSENPEVQRRCLIGIANMVESDEKVASELIAVSVSLSATTHYVVIFRAKYFAYSWRSRS